MSEEVECNRCEKATGDYKYKVEGFAALVKKYIERKGSNHHVAFLIDEIGQYIGNDSKLMLNFQTVTEDLGSVPSELVGCFNLIFYSSAEDTVFKTLGVE